MQIKLKIEKSSDDKDLQDSIMKLSFCVAKSIENSFVDANWVSSAVSLPTDYNENDIIEACIYLMNGVLRESEKMGKISLHPISHSSLKEDAQ